MENLKDLVNRVKDLVSHPRYSALADLWRRHNALGIVERIPFCMDMRDSMWGRFLHRDLRDLTADNIEGLIRFQLEQKIFYHDRIADDTIIGATLHTNPFAVPEISRNIFGATRTNIPDTEGWSVEVLVKDPADLESLPQPRVEFDPAAAQERADRFSDLLDGELPVSVPRVGGFTRGPMDTAVQLRGWENLMFDFIDRPAFVHDLMEYITTYRIGYETRRAELLGLDLASAAGGLWEDDVNCDVLSPGQYEEFVFPYEKRMAALFGEVTYHSCGNLTPVLPLIGSIPQMKKLYFSEPWTDFRAAKAVAENRQISLSEGIRRYMEKGLATAAERLEESHRYLTELAGTKIYTVRI